MAQYSRLSIWEHNPQHMSWYDYVVGRTTPAEPFITPNTELSGSSSNETLSYGNVNPQELAYQEAWFNELKRSDREEQVLQENSTQATTSNGCQLLHTGNGVLQQNPYFEYMFADAGLDTGSGCSDNSIDKLSFDKDDSETGNIRIPEEVHFEAPSPPEWQPRTPKLQGQDLQIIDVTFPRKCELVEACVSDINSAVAANTHLISIDAGLRGCHLNGVADRISTGNQVFQYYGFATGNTNCGDQVNCKGISPGFFGTGAEYLSEEVEQNPLLPGQQYAQHELKSILKPKSQRSKLQRSLTRGHNNPAKLLASTVKNVASKACLKRKAEQTLLDISVVHEEVRVVPTKKPCLDHQRDTGTEIVLAEPIPPVTEVSAFSDTSSCRTVSVDFFNHKPLAVAPKGYAGQFDGMVVKQNRIADFKFNLTGADTVKSGLQHTFGDARHPNGVFTHTSISIDPLRSVPDFTKENLPMTHPLFTCMNFATEMTIAATHANVVKLRNHDEEILRREAHIECARARLEGVSVGYYRYYQGHLSVEEYHDAEMCIC